ncbi:class I SAM-dependent methyltransferase [Kribbella deserti]|uniref:Class I SAM-dependent methyltransferase n=1 Tax=Kribbella deserti TaxID=1926257 RepID=A0ABV6QR30_9ACTN
MSARMSNNATERLFAAIYDPFLWLGERRGMRMRRQLLIGQARGHVLEIGAGTGLNLPYYSDEVEQLILTEPVGATYDLLSTRAGSLARTAVVQAPGDALPVESGTVDTVVSTLVLCTVPLVEPVLAEVVRILKPGGRLLFLEHVRASDGRLARRQDRLSNAWAVLAQGCRCDRDTESLLRRYFNVDQVRYDSWRGMPSLVRPLVTGTAMVKAR